MPQPKHPIPRRVRSAFRCAEYQSLRLHQHMPVPDYLHTKAATWRSFRAESIQNAALSLELKCQGTRSRDCKIAGRGQLGFR